MCCLGELESSVLFQKEGATLVSDKKNNLFQTAGLAFNPSVVILGAKSVFQSHMDDTTFPQISLF